MKPCRTPRYGWRELDGRETRRIEVTLLWKDGSSDELTVVVEDKVTGLEQFVKVPAPALAGDVFRHPFAYARAA